MGGERGGDLPSSVNQPTGAELVRGYLARLGEWLHHHPGAKLRLGTAVDAISRGGFAPSAAFASN